ncbi:MAG: hypothetical protein AB1499_14705, partial [Nitrospirota bacterium]
QSLARALLYSRMWELPSPPGGSGGEQYNWYYWVGEYDGTLSVPSGSEMLITLSEVDLQMRNIANMLVAAKSGASVLCHLELVEQSGNWIYARISMMNEGKKDCVIQNPFILSKANPKTDFIRIEAALPPVSEPGVTTSGFQYMPLPMPDPGKLAAPWDEEYVILRAGESIGCPQKISINLSTYRGYFVRAVYSHYGMPAAAPDLPLVRGCAFSNALHLQV